MQCPCTCHICSNRIGAVDINCWVCCQHTPVHQYLLPPRPATSCFVPAVKARDTGSAASWHMVTCCVHPVTTLHCALPVFCTQICMATLFVSSGASRPRAGTSRVSSTSASARSQVRETHVCWTMHDICRTRKELCCHPASWCATHTREKQRATRCHTC